MSNLLNVSPSPHLHGKESTRNLMLHVVLALIPAFITSVFYFGIGAIIVTFTSVASCVLFEYHSRSMSLCAYGDFLIWNVLPDDSDELTFYNFRGDIPQCRPFGIWIIKADAFETYSILKG